MTCKIRNTSASLCCSLQTDRKLWFSCRVPCEYEADTAAYAAAKFIRTHAEVRDKLIKTAVRLGLSHGKEAKPVQRQITVPARAMELPGNSATIYVTVSQGTVTIKGVRVI